MCEGTREDGSMIAPNDPHHDRMQAAARAARQAPAAWLAQDAIYGDLAREPRFAEAFEDWLALIWAEGTEAAIRRYLDA